MGKTSIQWTTQSANPIRARNKETGKVGWHCNKKSTGCLNCYSEAMNLWVGTGLPFNKHSLDKIELFLDVKPLEKLRRVKEPQKVFLCDMTDIFGSFIPDEWIDTIFAYAALMPWHTFQILTKRADRLPKYLNDRDRPHSVISAMYRGTDAGGVPVTFGWPLPNVWIGVSVEDQKNADERIPDLLKAHAAVRFLSVEPLLGPVEIDVINADPVGRNHDGSTAYDTIVRPLSGKRTSVQYGFSSDGPRIDQVIIGGESGRNARPFKIEWGIDLIGQCKDSEVAVFFKQAGACPFVDYYSDDESLREWALERGIRKIWAQHNGDIFEHRPKWDGQPPPFSQAEVRLKDKKGGDLSELPESLRVREFPRIGVTS